nr:MAG TPA: hypothetical protein [Caudoviricetes sp.]
MTNNINKCTIKYKEVSAFLSLFLTAHSASCGRSFLLSNAKNLFLF